MSVRARTRAPRTFRDTADLLDRLQHIRPHLDAAALPNDLRRDLESLACGAIARDPATATRRDQAGDLIRIGWAIRRSVWCPDRPLPAGFADMWAVRRTPGPILDEYATTLALLVDHMDRHAAELPPLLAAMAAVCPANLPVEDVTALARDTATTWHAVLDVTRTAAAEQVA